MLRKVTIALVVITVVVAALVAWGGVTTQNALSLRRSSSLDRCQDELFHLRTKLRLSPAAADGNNTEARQSSPSPAPSPAPAPPATSITEAAGTQGDGFRYHDAVSTGVPSVAFSDINSNLPIQPVLAIMFTGQLRLWCLIR